MSHNRDNGTFWHVPLAGHLGHPPLGGVHVPRQRGRKQRMSRWSETGPAETRPP